MNPVIVIQARLGSVRLPGKSLKLIQGIPLVGWLLRRLVYTGLPIVLAVPRKEMDDFSILKNHAWLDANGVLSPPAFSLEIFGGDESNVLDRYVCAAKHFDADPVIRVTGDNPLTSVEGLKIVLDRYRIQPTDLLHPVGLPHGSGVEVISRQALETANLEGMDPYSREHVTPYLYQNPGRFRVLQVPMPASISYPEIRTTVDTPEDFLRFENVVRTVPARNGYLRLADALIFLKDGRQNS